MVLILIIMMSKFLFAVAHHGIGKFKTMTTSRTLLSVSSLHHFTLTAFL